MSSWRCLGCRTVYAPGIPGCPNCKGGNVAKASAAGATQYVAEGAPVPGDLPPGVRLVGPGAPVAEAEAAPVKAAAAVKGRRARAAAAGG